MKNISLFVMSAASAVGLAACGDSSASSCGPFTGCGGNVVGTWQIKEICSSKSQAVDLGPCKTATLDFSGTTLEGSVTFNMDMTFTSAVTTKGKGTINYPSSCLNFMGLTLTCAQLDQGFKAEAMRVDSEIMSIQCVTSSTGCSCAVVFKPQMEMNTARWSTMGNLLAIDGETREYCVSGSTLHVKEPMAMMVGPSPFESIILVKK